MLEGIGDYLRRQDSASRLLISQQLSGQIIKKIGLTVKVIISDRRLVLECKNQAEAAKLNLSARQLAGLISQVSLDLALKRLIIRVGRTTY